MLGDRPLVAETPEHLLDDDTTPTGKFFIRNNGQMPEQTKEPEKWTITVDGEVNKKLELTLGELKSKFKPVTRRIVLECGGNGRSFFTPQARGNQWTNGGVGCAEWTGVRLADVLKAAGLKSSAVFTGHYGADPHLSGEPNRVALSRGVPIKKAMDPNNLIVWAMNGQDLPLVHGFPVRLVIAGWPGSVSAKWFNRVWVRDKPHDGQGMGGTSYRVPVKPIVPGSNDDGKTFRDLESMPVRSIITNPANGAKVGRRHEGAEAARRRLGRRQHCARGRNLGRLRRDLAERKTRAPEEQVRLAAFHRDREAAERRLLRGVDAGDGFARRHAAARGRQLEPAGLRRQPDAPHRGAGGVSAGAYRRPKPPSTLKIGGGAPKPPPLWRPTAAACMAASPTTTALRALGARRPAFLDIVVLPRRLRSPLIHQRRDLQLVEETARRIAARGLPARDHAAGFFVKLAARTGVETEIVELALHLRALAAIEADQSSVACVASAVKVAGSTVLVVLTEGVFCCASMAARRASASGRNCPLG